MGERLTAIRGRKDFGRSKNIARESGPLNFLKIIIVFDLYV